MAILTILEVVEVEKSSEVTLCTFSFSTFWNRLRGIMGSVCHPQSCKNCGSNAGTSDTANRRNRESGRVQAAKQLKQYVKDANLENICSRIIKGMGANDLSALLMSKDDLEKTITDLDDEWFEGHVSGVEKLLEIVAECMVMHGSNGTEAISSEQ